VWCRDRRSRSTARQQHTAGRRWPRLVVTSALAAGLVLLPGVAAAHDVPDEVRVEGFVHPDGDVVRVAVRLPLVMLSNMNLPRQGPGYLALDQLDQPLRDATSAVADGLVLAADGARLRATPRGARVSLPSDGSFRSFESAWAHVGEPPLPPSTKLFWNQGFLDVRLRYPLPDGWSQLSLESRIAPQMSDRLHLVVRYEPAGAAARTDDLVGGAGTVVLNPTWLQAARGLTADGAAAVGTLPMLWLFLVCALAPASSSRHLGLATGTVAAGVGATLAATMLDATPAGRSWPALVATLGFGATLAVACLNVVAPSWRGRWAAAVVAGAAAGVAAGGALAPSIQFAGSHEAVGRLAFLVGAIVASALVTGVMWLVVRPVRARLRHAAIVVSVLVGHAAWHWMVDRLRVLRVAAAVEWQGANVGSLAAGLARSVGLAALAAAVVWFLVEMLADRRGPGPAHGRGRPSGARRPHAPPRDETSRVP
jgi:hypothetical protein